MKPGNVPDFAHLLTQYRQLQGLSQGQLAQATRLSRTYIYHLEAGMRTNPSEHVVHNIVRALGLQVGERRHLYEAYTKLTGHPIDYEEVDSTLLDFGELAHLLVHNTSYPAHSLDRLWFLQSWNEAAITLFEIQDVVRAGEGWVRGAGNLDPWVAHRHLQGTRGSSGATPVLNALPARSAQIHLLELVFDAQRRRYFHGWENLARRLVSDFQYNTRTLTHLPEYKALWKRLRELPEFRRIASATYPEGKPAPSFVFQIQHSELGRVTLRTATTVFTGINSYSMVSYVPGDQQTLEIYRKQHWQPE